MLFKFLSELDIGKFLFLFKFNIFCSFKFVIKISFYIPTLSILATLANFVFKIRFNLSVILIPVAFLFINIIAVLCIQAVPKLACTN